MNSILQKILKSFIGFLICFCTLSVFAEAASAPTGPPPGQAAIGSSCAKTQALDVKSLPKITDSLKSSLDSSMLSGFTSTANGIANQLKGFGLALGGTLLLISMFSALAKAMVSNKSYGDIVVDHLITGAIIAAVIGSYETFSGYAVYVATYLNVIVGGTSPFAAILDLAVTFFASIGGISDAIGGSLSCLGIGDIPGLAGKLVDAIVSYILILIALVFLLLALGEIIYVLMLGPIALGVGVIVGPLAIATLAAGFTKEFFGKWLGFISAAALTQFVAYAILKLLGSFVTQGMASTGSFAAQALGIALIAYSAGKIFAMAPGMANALVPGTTGMSGVGGGGLATGMAITSGALAGVAVGAVTGISAAASAIKGGGGIASSLATGASAGASATSSVSQAVSKAFGSALGVDSKSVDAGNKAMTAPFSAANAAGQSAIDGAKQAVNALGGSQVTNADKATQVQTPSGKSGDELSKSAEKNSSSRQEKQWNAGADFRAGDKPSGEASGSSNQAKPTGVDSRPNKGLTS
jgi:type IV secretory pathway VirB6-like protein